MRLKFKIFKEIKKTFETFLKQKLLFLIEKILYFISISVKCIRCRIYGFQKKCDLVTYRQSDS